MPRYPCGLVDCACPAETTTSGHKGCVVRGPLPGGAFLAEVRESTARCGGFGGGGRRAHARPGDPGRTLRRSAFCPCGLSVLDTACDGVLRPPVFCVSFWFALCTPAHRRTCTPTRAHPHTCAPAHRHTRTRGHLHTCAPAHVHTCAPAHRHTRTRAHLHTLTPAHPHTCVDVPPFPSLTHTPASEARRRVAAPFASNGASGVSGCVVSDAAVTVSVWLCVPSPWKAPGSGIAGSRGHSVRDRPSGPQRQGAGLQLLLTPLPPPAGAGAGRPAGPGEVLHFRFRFHSLVTDGARRLPLWPLGFVHLLCGKVHSDPLPVLKFGRLFSMSSTVLQLF